MDAEQALGFAALLIAATEGAVITSRAQHSREPFDLAAALLITQAGRLTSEQVRR